MFLKFLSFVGRDDTYVGKNRILADNGRPLCLDGSGLHQNKILFYHLPCLRPHIFRTLANICITLILLERAFTGLHFCCSQYASICIRLAVVASQTREIMRNCERIRPYSSSGSSKVIDLGVNRKPICDFLLVINSNFSRIWYRFRDIDA